MASIHYQQPEAVASIRKLDRLVEVSHWGGNLAVQDNIDLFNSGPTYVLLPSSSLSPRFLVVLNPRLLTLPTDFKAISRVSSTNAR
jgi:hypothetical protein